MFDLLASLSSSPVVAVLRSPDAGRVRPVSAVLVEEGVRAIEITLTTAGALEAIASLRREYGEEVLVGAGTVRTPEHARQAIDSGAQFVVSQLTDARVHEVTARARVPYVPGALTPNEIASAWDLGVPAVKVSPVGPVGGVQYIGELRGPLPDIALMPTGGVRIEDVPGYLHAGAAVVGVSGYLIGDSLNPDGDLAGLRQRAHLLTQTVRDHLAHA